MTGNFFSNLKKEAIYLAVRIRCSWPYIIIKNPYLFVSLGGLSEPETLTNAWSCVIDLLQVID